MLTDLPFDLFILLLRAGFIFLLYFFLFQVVRVISRELQAAPTVGAREHGSATPHLTLVDPGQSGLIVGSTYHLQPVTTIGRSSDNSLPLTDAFLSGHHARLVQTNGRWYLADLGSTNGTFLNGRQVGREALLANHGDLIQLGRIKLRLSV